MDHFGRAVWRRRPARNARRRDYIGDFGMQITARELVTAAGRRDRVSIGTVAWKSAPPARAARDARQRGQCAERPIEGSLHLHWSYGAASPTQPLWLHPRAQPHGGLQWLLLCVPCGRFYRRLFVTGEPFLSCRKCSGLHYPSQSAAAGKRRQLRAERLARQVVPYWDDGGHFPPRPKGAHRKRYGRLLDEWRSLRFESLR